MRFICWNMNKRRQRPTWEYLLELKPDICLLQESKPPTSLEFGLQSRLNSDFRIIPNEEGGQTSGSALLVRHGLSTKQARFSSAKSPWVANSLNALGRAFVVAELEWADKIILLVSGYSHAYLVPSLNPDMSVEDRIEAARASYKKNGALWGLYLLWRWLTTEVLPRPCIVGGDFNASVKYDRSWGEGHQEMLDRYTQAGLVECLRQFHPDPESTPTFKNTDGGAIIHQVDYLWATPDLAALLKSCSVGSREIMDRRLSDHLPIIAEFGL